MRGLLDPPARLARDTRGWFLEHVGREQAKILGALLLSSLMLFGFLALADEVSEGETQAMDERIFLLFHEADGSPAGPAWVEEIGRDMTALGGNTILTFVTVAVFGFLLLHRRWQDAGIVAVSVTTGVVLSLLLKEMYDRARPDLVAHLSHTVTSSFPSGHSMLAAVTYLTLGVLIAEMAERKREILYPLVVATLLTIMVGVSRLHVGVHWPTDVLAGWAIGAAWALFCWSLIRWYQWRQAVPHRRDDVPHDADRLASSDR